MSLIAQLIAKKPQRNSIITPYALYVSMLLFLCLITASLQAKPLIFQCLFSCLSKICCSSRTRLVDSIDGVNINNGNSDNRSENSSSDEDNTSIVETDKENRNNEFYENVIAALTINGDNANNGNDDNRSETGYSDEDVIAALTTYDPSSPSTEKTNPFHWDDSTDLNALQATEDKKTTKTHPVETDK